MAPETDFIDIDTLGKLDLPSLPILKGEKDYKQWWKSVTVYFEVLELEMFLNEDIKEPQDPEQKRKWQKCRRFIMVHLLKAINSEVQKDMETLGWDFRDPYNTIQMAQKAVTKVSSDSLRQLIDTWNKLNAKRYRNLKEFIQHAQQLRDTLKHHGYIVEDNMAIMTVLSAIEFVDAPWVYLLEHDFTSGNLSWSKLTSLCMAKGNIQLTRAAFNANTGKTTGQDESQAPDQSQQQDRPQRPRYDENIECEGCGRYGWTQKDCYYCSNPTSGRGRGRGGRGGRGSSRGRGGRARGGQQQNNTSNELEGSSSQPQPQTQPAQQTSQQPQSQQPKPQKPNQQQQQKPAASEALAGGWPTGNLAVRNVKDDRDTWVADSGANIHVTNNMKWFINFSEFSTPRMINGHSSESTLAWGSGTVLLPALNPAGLCPMKLQDVWFAPTAPYSLLSINQLQKYSATLNGLTSSITCMKTGLIIASIQSWNDIMTVKLNIEEVLKLKDPEETKLAFFSMDFKVLHRRLMHAGLERTIKAAEQANIRLLNKPTKRFHCESCELAKSHEIVSRETPTPA